MATQFSNALEQTLTDINKMGKSEISTTTNVPQTNHTTIEVDNTKINCNCEDRNLAGYFCQDCSESLCEQCVKAHKRVGLTKNHVIVVNFLWKGLGIRH